MSGALRAEDGHSHRHGAAAPDSAADGTHGSSHGDGQEPLGFVGKEGCTAAPSGCMTAVATQDTSPWRIAFRTAGTVSVGLSSGTNSEATWTWLMRTRGANSLPEVLDFLEGGAPVCQGDGKKQPLRFPEGHIGCCV